LAYSLRAAARAENRAAGQRLAVIGELDVLWLRRFGEREKWCTDAHEAITAEVAAALGITRGWRQLFGLCAGDAVAAAAVGAH
jgi:hypothetical protein